MGYVIFVVVVVVKGTPFERDMLSFYCTEQIQYLKKVVGPIVYCTRKGLVSG